MRLIIHTNDEAMALEAVRAAFYADVSKDHPICGVQINRKIYGVRLNKGGSVTVYPNDYDARKEKRPGL